MPGDEQHLISLSEDFSRTLNHDLGYDAYLKSSRPPHHQASSYDSLRLTKFDVLKALQSHYSTSLPNLLSFIASHFRSKHDSHLARHLAANHVTVTQVANDV